MTNDPGRIIECVNADGSRTFGYIGADGVPANWQVTMKDNTFTEDQWEDAKRTLAKILAKYELAAKH